MILQIAFVLLIAGMAVRLYQLQVIQHDFYAQKVLPRGKSSPSLATGPRRGGIYDQKGRELAVSVKLDSVYGIPGRLQQEDNTKIHRMCNILQVAASSLESKLESKLDSRQYFIWIKRKVSPQVVTRLEELDLDGIGFREENQRYYPAKELSAQVLGFTGLDNHGLEGVELFFDDLLSNTEPSSAEPYRAEPYSTEPYSTEPYSAEPYRTEPYSTEPYSTANRIPLQRAANRIPLQRAANRIPLQRAGAGVASNPADGKQAQETARPYATGNHKACNIFLTLDKVIQYQTEKELNASCTASRAKAGTAIVMDVENGEILAMANWPPFNPNSFSKYPPEVRRNRCITDAFEPGSVFKIFLAAAAIEDGKVDRNNIIYCENGSMKIGRRTIRDTHQNGWLTFGDIIRVSSNIGAAKVGLSLGSEKFSQTIKDFGFGSKTGIRLPGEAKGFIPPIKRWTELTTANISFGQGMLTTPLQLITAVSCVANKGLWREPKILKSVMQGEEQKAGTKARQLCASAPLPLCALTEASDPGPFRRVVSAATCETLTEMLEMVVISGTGTAAFIPGYRVAGKTGTAQKVDPVTRRYSQDLFCSSFVGFFPASSPRIAILVTIDEPKEEHLAGVVAAPVFRKIAKSIIRYRNIPPAQREDGETGRGGEGETMVQAGKEDGETGRRGDGETGTTSADSPLRLARTGSLPEEERSEQGRVLSPCRSAKSEERRLPFTLHKERGR